MAAPYIKITFNDDCTLATIRTPMYMHEVMTSAPWDVLEGIESVAMGLKSGVIYDYDISSRDGLGFEIRESSSDHLYPHIVFPGSKYYPLNSADTILQVVELLTKYVEVARAKRARCHDIIETRLSDTPRYMYNNYPKYSVESASKPRLLIETITGFTTAPRLTSVPLTVPELEVISRFMEGDGLFRVINIKGADGTIHRVKLYEVKIPDLVIRAKAALKIYGLRAKATLKNTASLPTIAEMASMGVDDSNESYVWYAKNVHMDDCVAKCYNVLGVGSQDQFAETLIAIDPKYPYKLAFYLDIISGW